MIQKGARAVAEALKATMETWLPGILTEVAAAWSNDTTLPEPDTYYSVMQLDRPEPTTLEIDCRTGQQRANSAQTSETEGFGELAYDFSVIVSTGGELLQDTIQRGEMYQQAIWEVLMQHNRLDERMSGLTGIDPMQMGFDFGKATDMANFRVHVGWRGMAYVEQTVG